MKSILFLCFISLQLSYGQSGAMGYNNYSRTLSSFGLGDQGVASRSGIDGLIFNPANLVHTSGTQVSFYRNPFYYIGFDGLPMISIAAATVLPDDIQIGAEFMSWDHDGIFFTEIDPTPIEYQSYNRTFALGAATHLSPEWGVGLLARYSKDRFGVDSKEQLFGSAGVQYFPALFQDRLRIGFSLMNFSTAMKYTVTQSNGTTRDYFDPPSSFLRLGFEYDAVRQQLFSTTIHAEVSKELTKWGGIDGQSSFQSLFNDWNDAPRDMTIHGGLSFLFQPIPLGRSVTFVQEIYTGYLHDGPKSGRRTMFYNGFNAGFGFGGTTVTAGYAGLWHIVDDDVYSIFTNNMPWETFQISLRSTLPGGYSDEPSGEGPILDRIILSLNGGYVVRTGRSSEQKVLGTLPEYYTVTSNDVPSYAMESAMYLTDRSALTAQLRYEHRTLTYTAYFGSPATIFSIPIRMETLTLSSGYRYHPFQELEPLFFETGIGVQRQNPIENTRPRYKYASTFFAGTGALLPISMIAVTPRITFMSLLDRIPGSAPRLGSYNHFEFTLSIGYLFE
jgi:hypothetical protein